MTAAGRDGQLLSVVASAGSDPFGCSFAREFATLIAPNDCLHLAVVEDDETDSHCEHRSRPSNLVSTSIDQAPHHELAMAEAVFDQRRYVDRFIRKLPAIPTGRWSDLTSEDIESGIGRTLTGVTVEAVEVARRMATQGGGSILFLLPVDSSHAYPNRGIVSVAAMGIRGLVRTLALEFAEAQVRVNAISYGPIEVSGCGPLDGDAVTQTMRRSPVHAFGEVADVARAAAFVSGEGIHFMTGSHTRVDGGWSALNSATNFDQDVDRGYWTS